MQDKVKRKVAIMGSTGSIGRQALEVIDECKENLEVSVLSANSNADLLIEQALRYNPNAVVIVDRKAYQKVQDVLFPKGIKVYTGSESLDQIVAIDEVDIVLTAIVGFAGLRSTLKAIEAGKDIALANKETLVVAGDVITKAAREKGVNIYPVDSEHSAIFQCLAGEFHNPVEKIILTASGGPFRGKDKEFLSKATRKEALKHPNWDMGQKITIDSATLINKGLEVIEAKWLFGLKNEQIEVLIHPQSIIHSMVQFRDGAIKAELGTPDMRLPIQYALGYPNRIPNNFERLDFSMIEKLTFEKPDTDCFPGLALAFDALHQGGNVPCILNAANEVAVAAFLQEKIKFPEISNIIERCMRSVSVIKQPELDDYFETDTETRHFAQKLIQ